MVANSAVCDVVLGLCDFETNAGIYSNNPHTLLRFDLPEQQATSSSTTTAAVVAERRYTLVLSQFEKKRDVRYTLNVYCTSDFKLLHTPEPPTHQHKVQVRHIILHLCRYVCARELTHVLNLSIVLPFLRITCAKIGMF
jgi:hypothetical protein